MTRPFFSRASGWIMLGVIVGALIGEAVRADDRCAETRAMPGAVEDTSRDLIVIAPRDDGSFRFCYWNSPQSFGGTYVLHPSGTEIIVKIQVTGGPEYVLFELPGAIATDLRGVPLAEVFAPDGDEVNGLLWLGAV